MNTMTRTKGQAPPQLRVFSYGGGVQSTAALVLAAAGKIDFKTFLFCNVGDDSEHPATLRYVHEVAMPYAAARGLDLQELKRHTRDGQVETLYGRLTRGSERSIGIPARVYPSGAPCHRSCTADFKIRVVDKWLRQHGAKKKYPAMVGLGISMDESNRMRTTSGMSAQVLEYPLITLRLRRRDCLTIIEDAGLPRPGKSSCSFCPYHTLAVWQKQRVGEPELFARNVALETLLSERHVRLGRGPLFLSPALKPLLEATTAYTQGTLFAEHADDTCESGYCEL